MNQPLLPTIEPSENDLYKMAVAQPLEFKIQQAVKLLQFHEPPEGYYLAYSGGKDSGAILELATMAGVKFEAHYNVTTIDPPELVRFIKREHPEVVFNRPKKALFTRLAERTNGPPTRLARWCCEEYKEQGGNGRFKIIGVRTEESARRKATWKQVIANKNRGHILCPVLYWTDADIWEFHRLCNLPYCELYDQGFTRLGCIGCPLAGPKNQRKEFDRWPKYEEAWKRAFRRFWDRWHGVPTNKGGRRYFEDFGSWEGLWDWWISGNGKGSESDDCQGVLDLWE